jgi:DNA polymerase
MRAPFVSVDFETCSTVNLKTTGVSRYARAKGTHILCLAYAFSQGPVELWLPGDPFPVELAEHIAKGGRLHAWNANFERQIWRYICRPRLGWPTVPDEQWACTMAQGMYAGLPAGLDDAATALGLVQRKDVEGHRLMLQLCQPRSTRPDGTPVWWSDDPDPAKLIRLAAYCMQDVVVERDIANQLPPLPESERQVWLLDQRMNDTGIAVDFNLVDRMQQVAAGAKRDLNAELRMLTKGFATGTNQIATIQTWLMRNGCPLLLDMKRATLEAETTRLLSIDPHHPAAEVIRVRLDAARTSTAKLDAFQRATDEDGRLRCTLRYYGAGRTGRWSGAGGTRAQLQNLPRPTQGTKVAPALTHILAGCQDAHELAQYGDSPLGVIASCLRGCFVASPGHVLVCADLAQIEARVIAWLAGQHDVLDVFHRGEDIYTYTAGLIGSNNRTLGKVIRLALAYGMGSIKFVATALGYGVELGIAEAEAIVRAFRERSHAIRAFWYDLERAMMWAVNALNGNSTYVRAGGGRIGFMAHADGVEMLLPAGRGLFYRNARIEWDDNFERDSVVYDGLHQKTRQWGPIRTYGGKLAENATQAVARDVLAEHMLTLDGLGHRLLLTSHDEIIAEAPERESNFRLAEMLDVMARPIDWAPGLPVRAEGFVADRYRK